MKKSYYILRILILIVTLLQFISCRYSKPLTSNLIKVDSIKKDTLTIIKTYNYLRISRNGIFGLYEISEKYSDNKLVYEKFEKRSTNRFFHDGRTLNKWKTIEYKNGKTSKIDKYIFKNKGKAGRFKLAKSLIYDEKGKLVKTINENKKQKTDNN